MKNKSWSAAWLFFLIFIGVVSCGGGSSHTAAQDNDDTNPPASNEGVDPGAVLSDGTVGNPVFTLTWSHSESNEGPDIDMFVLDPKHAMLSTSRDGYSLGPTPESGEIDYDDQGETGPGDGGGPERAYWPAGQMPPGVYIYGVRYYGGTGTADYTFRVYKDGHLDRTHRGTLSNSSQRNVLGAACNVPAVQALCDLYNSNLDRFLYCQDLAYAALTGQAPPHGNYSKASLKDLLDREGYVKVYENAVPQTPDSGLDSLLVDGDIIMFYNGEPPNDPTDAPHYAVVRGGKIWQILHWEKGGQLDGPRDLSYFWNTRTMINAFTGETRMTQNAYVYYVCYNR